MPDTIEVNKVSNDGVEVAASFKNTSESTAKTWLEQFIRSHGFENAEVDVCQSGDYNNDWVDAYCVVV